MTYFLVLTRRWYIIECFVSSSLSILFTQASLTHVSTNMIALGKNLYEKYFNMHLFVHFITKTHTRSSNKMMVNKSNNWNLINETNEAKYFCNKYEEIDIYSSRPASVQMKLQHFIQKTYYKSCGRRDGKGVCPCYEWNTIRFCYKINFFCLCKIHFNDIAMFY